MDLREQHAINMEMGARHSRMSMDPASHSWYENYGTNQLTLNGFTTDYGIVAPVIGDGWIPQLELIAFLSLLLVSSNLYLRTINGISYTQAYAISS